MNPRFPLNNPLRHFVGPHEGVAPVVTDPQLIAVRSALFQQRASGLAVSQANERLHARRLAQRRTGEMSPMSQAIIAKCAAQRAVVEQRIRTDQHASAPLELHIGHLGTLSAGRISEGGERPAPVIAAAAAADDSSSALQRSRQTFASELRDLAKREISGDTMARGHTLATGFGRVLPIPPTTAQEVALGPSIAANIASERAARSAAASASTVADTMRAVNNGETERFRFAMAQLEHAVGENAELREQLDALTARMASRGGVE